MADDEHTPDPEAPAAPPEQDGMLGASELEAALVELAAGQPVMPDCLTERELRACELSGRNHTVAVHQLNNHVEGHFRTAVAAAFGGAEQIPAQVRDLLGRAGLEV